MVIEHAKGALMLAYGVSADRRSGCCGGARRKPTSSCAGSRSW
ncbi:hypothetical protein [Nocardia salmonicida]